MFRLPPFPRSEISFSGPPGSERLLLLGARLLPRRVNRVLGRDIETERLWLRSLNKWRTVLLIAPWHRDPELMDALMPRVASPSMIAWLLYFAMPDNSQRFSYAIVPKGRRRAVGMISVHLGSDGSAESHIAIHDRAWRGRQVSVEARAALLDLFFAHGVSRFIAAPPTSNLGSVFLYKKLGFRVTGTMQRRIVLGGKEADIEQVSVELTREDWQRHRARDGAASQPRQPQS